MDTDLLKTFLEVSRTRHFGRAAEALYLTQSAVSFRIRQLENNMGVSLFTRHRNNIRLTAAGERFLPYAESLMNTWQAAKKEVATSSNRNEMSIGACAIFWEYMLTDWLQNVHKQFKELQLEARIEQRQALVKQLHERQLDLLITTEAPKMDELTSQLLGHFTLMLYSAQPGRLKVELNYLRLEWCTDMQQYESGLMSTDCAPPLTTSSLNIARHLLAEMNGCIWLPENWAKRQSDLHIVSDSTTLSRPLYAVWLQNCDKQQWIADLLKVSFGF